MSSRIVHLTGLLAAIPSRSVWARALVAVPILVAWTAASLGLGVEILALLVAHAALLVIVVVSVLAAIWHTGVAIPRSSRWATAS
jgi:DNA-binding helix-hairpin-helix protein with protein kinase domain